MNRMAGILLIAALQAAPGLAGDPSAGGRPERPASPDAQRERGIVPPSLFQCHACHSFAPGEAHRAGPNLWEIGGHPAATRPGYPYSTALKRSGIVWRAETLDTYLADPQVAVPGNRMGFGGIEDPVRRATAVADLLALTTAKAAPDQGR